MAENEKAEARADECPRCGSDDPALAFDTLRPEKPRQPATWTDSAGGTNWICGDPFHEPASTDQGESREEARVELAERLDAEAESKNWWPESPSTTLLREAASALRASSPPEREGCYDCGKPYHETPGVGCDNANHPASTEREGG